jgi:mannitol-specific phosphotransferase system IIBC component
VLLQDFQFNILLMKMNVQRLQQRQKRMQEQLQQQRQQEQQQGQQEQEQEQEQQQEQQQRQQCPKGSSSSIPASLLHRAAELVIATCRTIISSYIVPSSNNWPSDTKASKQAKAKRAQIYALEVMPCYLCYQHPSAQTRRDKAEFILKN